ncbi:efflux RND transporter periplasmic adaptor subunit [Enhygromyxa salina]|uniref:Nickel and cobalt resistance protein CnrB n=1 Tax=Enhygromyxa salina TaxID=215803 RepID=A0A2S9YT01_9BACT|nr:HlyD family efflux transporter periplasmic adaptor subunit [Enhygromyxa salina]PRQ08190.1 Nickel and cobalt resistance protein CnrB [Enhygromyxa salina]
MNVLRQITRGGTLGWMSMCMLGCGLSRAQDQPMLDSTEAARTSELSEAATTDAPPEKFHVGVIIAREAIDLSAEISGTLTGTQLPIGTRVEAGTLLAQVEVAGLDAQFEAAQAALQAHSADLAQRRLSATDAQRQDLRETALADAGISPEGERERARLELELAKANRRKAAAELRQGKAALTGLRAKRESGQLVAPFTGKISSWYRAEGELVQVGDVVVRVTAVDDLWVRFAVPIADLGDVAPGDAITVSLMPRGERVAGIIQHLAPELDLSSQMIFVEAQLQRTDLVDAPELMVGQGCHVSIVAPAGPERDR